MVRLFVCLFVCSAILHKSIVFLSSWTESKTQFNLKTTNGGQKMVNNFDPVRLSFFAQTFSSHRFVVYFLILTSFQCFALSKLNRFANFKISIYICFVISLLFILIQSNIFDLVSTSNILGGINGNKDVGDE